MKTKKEIKGYLEILRARKRAIHSEIDKSNRNDWDEKRSLFGELMDIAIKSGTLEWTLSESNSSQEEPGYWLDNFSELEQGEIKQAIFAFRPRWKNFDVKLTTCREIVAKMAHLLDGKSLVNIDERYDEIIAPQASKILDLI